MFSWFVTFFLVCLVLCTPPDVPTGAFIYYDDLNGEPYNVTADERSFIINGKRTIMLGGSVHYPRFSPGQWNDILSKARNDGLNHVEVYVFWNLHEFTYDFSGKHVYNFEGRANLPKFLETCANAGLFVNLRIGPYVCAEWDFGGLPVWLLHVQNIEFRADNQAWEDAMSTFINDLTPYIEPYLAKNGGPIVISQIENEYHGSMNYVDWCGTYAISLNYSIPWVMCNGESAPETINTCNGNNCYSYAQNHGKNYPGQLLGWTENEGWFQYWGRNYDPNSVGWANRSPQDMAYSVSLWIASGGVHHNYYMWCGGNHISHWAGSSIANYYADGVNYHADGLVHEPKRTHLYKLHKIIADNQIPLLSTDAQVGNEIPITPNGFNYTYALYSENCNNDNNINQIWIYDNNTMQLKLKNEINNNYMCVSATGNSDPVPILNCEDNNIKQQWKYTSNNQFISQYSNLCLDIFSEIGPNIDEYECKDPSSSSAKNQQWIFNNNNMLVSQYNNEECLTSSESMVTFAYVYTGPSIEDKITFLVNTGSKDESVTWNNITYDLPGTSVSILDWQDSELYNSAKVDSTDLPTERVYSTLLSGKNDLKFSSWTEYYPLINNTQKRTDNSYLNKSPYEQIRFTNESSEYFIYTTQFKLSSSYSNNNIKLNFDGRMANAYLVYIDNNYLGEVYDYEHNAGNKVFNLDLNMSFTSNNLYTLTIISSSLGIDNYAGIAVGKGPDYQDKKGLVGNVILKDTSSNNNIMDLTNNNWYHWISSTGENLMVYGNGMNSVTWTNPPVTSNSFTWYMTTFNIDSSVFNSGVILIDIGSNSSGMKRGHIYLNGINMGHYNNIQQSNMMVQQYYFIPNDMLNTGNNQNTLMFAEELNNVNPTNTNIVISNVVIPSSS